MVEMEIARSPLLALLGYVHDLPKSRRRFVAVALLLAKRELALKWTSKKTPTLKAWLLSMTFCNTISDAYAQLQPPASRPVDIWQPFLTNLLNEGEEKTASTPKPPTPIN